MVPSKDLKLKRNPGSHLRETNQPSVPSRGDSHCKGRAEGMCPLGKRDSREANATTARTKRKGLSNGVGEITVVSSCVAF